MRELLRFNSIKFNLIKNNNNRKKNQCNIKLCINASSSIKDKVLHCNLWPQSIITPFQGSAFSHFIANQSCVLHKTYLLTRAVQETLMSA